ncbi:MAG: 1,2-phenylacetyl-CoA epoxidase subunit PaaD [Betaproteobacteria bacterium]
MVSTERHASSAAATAVAAQRPDPGLGVIWQALAGVTDPEIPVVSVIDLGIVRAVEWDSLDPAILVVRVTPTYSGCPATELIMSLLRETLLAIGVRALRIEIALAPAWTTAWLTPEGARQLRAYGIAPPGSASPADTAGVAIDVTGISPLRRAAATVPCPRCGSHRTQLVAQFGSTACKAQYRCLACLEPFDYFKQH